MIVSITSTVILAVHQGKIKIGKVEMEEVNECSYLGSVIRKDGATEKERNKTKDGYSSCSSV